MAVGIGGVYWWTNKPVLATPVPLARESIMPVGIVDKVHLNVVPSIIPKENNLPPVQQMTKSLLPIKAEALPQPEPSRQVEQSRPVQQARQVEQPVAVSTDEMQKLVRAAGKSLRGQ